MANLNACSACACPHSKLVKCTLNMVDICVVVMHAFTLPGQWITFEPSDSSSLSLNYMSTSSLASQTHFRKKGLVKCICNPGPTALYSAMQSHHMTHYITVWIAIMVLKTATGSWDIFMLLQKLWTLRLYCLESLHSTYFKSALFEIWLHYLANCIPVVHGLYTQYTSWKWVWLARLVYKFGCRWVHYWRKIQR